MTWAWVFTQLEYLLRLVLAGVCGGLIGYERNNRLKEAGIRTHLIVCLASSLMMLISKYGFFDILGKNINLDPSRIAAGIVTGVGFLGAGIIFFNKHNHNISGLTTSAGVWATVGIGMAMGAGMYPIGLVGTLLIIASQVLLHKNFRWLKTPTTEQILIQIKNSDSSIQFLQTVLSENHIEIENLKTEKLEEDWLEIVATIKLPETFDFSELISLFKRNPEIRYMEMG